MSPRRNPLSTTGPAPADPTAATPPAPRSDPPRTPTNAPTPGAGTGTTPAPAPRPGTTSGPTPPPTQRPDATRTAGRTPNAPAPGATHKPTATHTTRPDPNAWAAHEPGVGAAPRSPAESAAHTAHAAPLTVSVCRDPAEFGAMAAQWGRLHRQCAATTPFQSHAWLHSWWLSYGRRGRLRVVVVRRGGELVAAAPLMVTYRPLPVLVALGGAITDYTDVLVDESDPAHAAALAEALRRAARTALIDLREVRPGAAAERVYGAWRGPRKQLADSVCLELPGLPMDELIARVGSSRGQRIRSHLRKLDAAGVEERVVPVHEVPTAVETMLRLHLLQWQGRGVTPEHVRPRFAEHLTRAARQMVAAGDASITEFSLGGEVVAANLTVLCPSLAGGYLYGAHPDLRSTKVDVTTLLMRHGVQQTRDGGRAALSLLRGAEPHKFHWRPEHIANRRLLLTTRPLAAVLFARVALAAARTRLAATTKHRLPAVRAWRARLNDRLARRDVSDPA